MVSTQEYVYRARMAEQTERFDDMVSYMKKVIESGEEIQEEERNLISIAYKNSVGQKRTAWRGICQFQQKERQNTNYRQAIEFYRKNIEEELHKQCNEIIQILDTTILPKQSSDTNNIKDKENLVFFLKMKADYYRYLCEFTQSDDQNKYSNMAEKVYQQAFMEGKSLKPYDTIKLGLCLNHSVFYYEIKNDIRKAIETANKAHEDALLEIENFDDEQMKDATTVMQLLKDNQTNWENELQEEEDKLENNF